MVEAPNLVQPTGVRAPCGQEAAAVETDIWRATSKAMGADERLRAQRSIDDVRSGADVASMRPKQNSFTDLQDSAA